MLPNIKYGTAVPEDSVYWMYAEPKDSTEGPLDLGTVSLSLLDLSTAADCT